ncbi:hypothetical protein FDECE_13561 [Fusarium decemcellulare]|nr:hypothetical protein FDECE_13561 [Fusarium decemcellulare]
MARCLWVPEGYLGGCTVCNQVSHLVDTCDIFRRIPLERKIRVLIHDRCGLPPLKTESSWYEWFCLWLENPLPRHGSRIALPTGFPWTEQFTRDLLLNFNYVRLLQEEFDYHQDVNRLPQDPATRDMAAMVRTFSTVEGDLI